MVAQRLDGKACAASVEKELHERIAACTSAGIQPHLAVVIVGDDPAKAAAVAVVRAVAVPPRLLWRSRHALGPLPWDPPSVRFRRRVLFSLLASSGVLDPPPASVGIECGRILRHRHVTKIAI